MLKRESSLSYKVFEKEKNYNKIIIVTKLIIIKWADIRDGWDTGALLS